MIKIKKFTVFCILLLTMVVSTSCKKEESPKDAFEKYKAAWEKQELNSMYGMLAKESKDKIKEEDFSTRYSNIYKGIDAANITIKPEYPEKLEGDKEGKLRIPFSITMDTKIGNIDVTGYEAILIQEKVEKKKEWKLIWDEKMIFPAMEADDVVRYNTYTATRGEIYDRNNSALAVNGNAIIIEVVPSKFNPTKDTSIPAMAELLDMKVESIQKILEKAKNNDQAFPVVTLMENDIETAKKLTLLPGVQRRTVPSRVYQSGEALGRLIGYIGEITADELQKNSGKGYSQSSKIGKAGLEQVYEDRLRGENGGEIYIAAKKDNKETKKATIAKKEAKQGENIKLTIDSKLQKSIYEEMKGDAGAATAVDPISGEILALVSSPSYDSNTFSTYETETSKANREASGKDPYVNRFSSAYVPGSTFKLITGAIGLKTGVTKPEEAENITGLQWQPDKSWGKNFITRVSDTGKPVNLKDAYIYSDNIYFAKQALKIGKDKLISESKAFGFGEALPIDYPIAKSQIANGDKITSDGLLANTGYGQGEVLMSPLHINLIYSSLVTNGNIMTPVLELKSDTAPKVWKENAIGQEHTKILLEDLTAVVEDPNGTGYKPLFPGLKIAGKTGTAEINKTAQGEKAQELGWFVGFNTVNPKLSVVMMIEDVHGRGGSHYVVPKVKKVMDEYLKK